MAMHRVIFSGELKHYGVKGMHWGIRRYQDYDGRRIGKNGQPIYNHKKASKKQTNAGMSAFISRKENMRNIRVTDTSGKVYDSASGQWKFYNITPKSFDETLEFANEQRQGREDDPAFNNNCVNCAAAGIMLKKGYGVCAGPNTDGASNLAFSYYFDNAIRKEPKTYDELKQTISDFGPGRYGTLCSRLNHGVGHAVCWENDTQGNTTIYEEQTGRKESFDGYFNNYGFRDDFLTCAYDMTDATPNIPHMVEDHVFMPSFAPDSDTLTFDWANTNRTAYFGPSKDDADMTTYKQRRMYNI